MLLKYIEEPEAVFVVNLVSKMYHLDDAVLVEFHPASRFPNPESENILERKNRDSIIYPSVKDYSRWNIAIRNSDVKERLTINGTTEIEIIDVHPNHYRVKQLRVYYFDDKQLKTRTPMNEIDYHYGTYFEKDPNIILNDFLKDHIYLRKQTNN